MWWHKLQIDRDERWKVMMQLIYKNVNEMGRKLTDQVIHQWNIDPTKSPDDGGGGGLNSVGRIANTVLHLPDPETLAEDWAEAFYYDPIYGLNDLTNVRKWHAALNEKADQNKQLAFEAELRTYFGVTKAGID